MFKTSLLLLSFAILAQSSCADTPADSSGGQKNNALAINEDLKRFWLGIEAPEVRLQWHAAAWGAKFAQTVKPDIIDAIIQDLRREETPYPGRAKAGLLGRRMDYEAIIVSLEPKSAYAALFRWQRTGSPTDKKNATAFIRTLRTQRLAKQTDGAIWWERLK
jgi:hypothetical protein